MNIVARFTSNLIMNFHESSMIVFQVSSKEITQTFTKRLKQQASLVFKSFEISIFFVKIFLLLLSLLMNEDNLLNLRN